MTPNELNLIQKAADWVDEKNTRSLKLEYHNKNYGWYGYEKSFQIWCYDSEINYGFILTEEEPDVYNDEEMKKRKREELLKEIEERR